eukprot:m.98431 g.98431  ORF g.98431 m.98431 type:complete len:116 (+) comp36987_c0_seq5:4654-5001(+)
MNYYEYLWERNRGVNFRSLFEGMPTTLQADITLSLYKRILDEVPLFQNTELGFAKLLSMAIKPIYFLTGEYVVRKGDAGHETIISIRCLWHEEEHPVVPVPPIRTTALLPTPVFC